MPNIVHTLKGHLLCRQGNVKSAIFRSHLRLVVIVKLSVRKIMRVIDYNELILINIVSGEFSLHKKMCQALNHCDYSTAHIFSFKLKGIYVSKSEINSFL